jgi:hypothetical protein
MGPLGTANQMIVIGLTGPIGHGKTTFANALERLEPNMRHFESSAVIIDVANAWHATLSRPIDPYDIEELNGWLQTLPQILRELLGIECTYEQIRLNPESVQQHPVEYQKLIMHAEELQRDFRMAHQPITNENKESYRPILQWLGGYLVEHVDKGIWYQELARRIETARNEGCALCIVGGIRYPNDATILREAGAKIVKLYRPGHLQNDMLDPTERERDNIVVDCTIMSTGSQEDLAACARRFFDDIRNNNLQQVYRTVTM